MKWIPDKARREKLIAKYGGSHEDFFSRTPHPSDYYDNYEPEPAADRVISVTLNEAEQEVLDAIFTSIAWNDPSLIKEEDWDTIVSLGKKLGSGNLRQL